jgi:predicted nucleic acid-binding protein
VLVVDASVLVTALADDGPDGDQARPRLRGERLFAPELVDPEVTSVLRRQSPLRTRWMTAAPQWPWPISPRWSSSAPHRALLGRCWELRENLTIYDAAYVAPAETLGANLLAGDRRLARAPGPRCRIEVLTPAR